MTENERVKLVRTHFSLTMELFGERVGLKRSAVSLVESGRNSVSNQLRNAICREFHVSEDWLRDGIGGNDIVFEEALDAAAEFAKENNLDNVEETLIREYLKLDEKTRTIFRKFVKNVARELDEIECESEPDEDAKGGTLLPFA